MHPRQASIVAQATEIADRLAAKKKETADKPLPASPMLWEYEDPDGKIFYLQEKKTTVKSPFTGKSFPARPKKHTPAQVGKEMKDQRAEKMASEEDLWRA